jgi:hypothetical protein
MGGLADNDGIIPWIGGCRVDDDIRSNWRFHAAPAESAGKNVILQQAQNFFRQTVSFMSDSGQTIKTTCRRWGSVAPMSGHWPASGSCSRVIGIVEKR